jgi:hypothetical protein
MANRFRWFHAWLLLPMMMGAVSLAGCGKKSGDGTAGDSRSASAGDTKPSSASDSKPDNESDSKKAGDTQYSREEAKQRLQSVNNLMQLLQGSLLYHSALNRFPPADGPILDSYFDGLSIRAYLLSYIELNELYDGLAKKKYPLAKGAGPKEFWNRPILLEKALVPFKSPIKEKAKNPGDTFYRVFLGPGAAFEPGKELKGFRDFSKGPKGTILFVEAGEAVPWTKPDELNYDPKKPLPKLGGLFADGFYAGFGDGAVRFIPRDIDEKLLRSMIERNAEKQMDRYPKKVDVEALRRQAGN